MDPSAAAAEVLAELELQQSRMAQLSAQAGELASVGRELAGGDDALLAAAGGGEVPAEVKDAEAAVQVRLVWGRAGHMAGLGPAGHTVTAGWRSAQASIARAQVALPPLPLPHHDCSAARHCGAWWPRLRHFGTAAA